MHHKPATHLLIHRSFCLYYIHIRITIYIYEQHPLYRKQNSCVPKFDRSLIIIIRVHLSCTTGSSLSINRHYVYLACSLRLFFIIHIPFLRYVSSLNTHTRESIYNLTLIAVSLYQQR